MLNTERNKIDKLWTSFWSGGISNPLTVIEQISYLLFIKGLDDKDNIEFKKAKRTGIKYTSIFPEDVYKWSTFKHEANPEVLFELFSKEIFPFIKNYKDESSVFSHYIRDATFLIPKASILHEAVQLISQLNMDNKDTKGDLYEYLLSKLSQAGVNGQFRTPRHIIEMMVELMDPKIGEKICDPACGTAGFLVAASEYVLKKYTDPQSVFKDEEGILHDKIGDLLSREQKKVFNENMFFGTDFDSSMLRISAMNLMLHGIEDPNIEYADALSSNYNDKQKYNLVLANPPFKGTLDESDINPTLKKVVNTKKTELLFMALINRILDLGGRGAVIVPDGVLFGSSKAHKDIRNLLVNENQLEGVISLPSGVFKPYAGVSTAILIFTKGGETDKVWFYEMQSDGFSLDDKRTPIIDNDIPDIIESWRNCKKNKDLEPVKGEKWFYVDREEILNNDLNLSIIAYKNVEFEEVVYEEPDVLINKIDSFEKGIIEDIKEIREMMNQ
ncbi:class I SAM-dependent DNA methyltransferase [Bacillus cereus]|uniref:class I SAM-dependent DNA methyltransferase n=1 Tax=Bacillus cereus group TaxID=86661 RepID=UPI0018D0BDEB|nr:class I SAM-dependent DNA methyltransferase [Bacillus cereus]MBH0318451.1 SAM-dependent DNA methyltransferase [Bacillus cereus]